MPHPRRLRDHLAQEERPQPPGERRVARLQNRGSRRVPSSGRKARRTGRRPRSCGTAGTGRGDRRRSASARRGRPPARASGRVGRAATPSPGRSRYTSGSVCRQSPQRTHFERSASSRSQSAPSSHPPHEPARADTSRRIELRLMRRISAERGRRRRRRRRSRASAPPGSAPSRRRPPNPSPATSAVRDRLGVPRHRQPARPDRRQRLIARPAARAASRSTAGNVRRPHAEPATKRCVGGGAAAAPLAAQARAETLSRLQIARRRLPPRPARYASRNRPSLRSTQRARTLRPRCSGLAGDARRPCRVRGSRTRGQLPDFGSGTVLNVASVITQSVPSEPM